MNRPPEKFKRIPVEQLQAFAAACLKAAGMRAEHADQLAELLTHGDLRGGALARHARALRLLPVAA
ncbi:MAG: hypothetical protein EXS64_00840 [Candidatus Latescibacteria bacterium]|nr:hypothetical protein [Candidatus Latescibacterota bacterium]